MERFLNFFFGDYAFADQCPVVAVDADDGGGEDAAGVAGIEDQREAIAELLNDLLSAGAGWKAGKIGAGAGDGAADGFDERGGDFANWPSAGRRGRCCL